jgi:two-component system, chemotaxis family, CheB/CheR fusion protein
LSDPKLAVGKSDFDFFDHAEEAYQVEQEIIRTGIPVVNQFHKLIVDGKTKYLSDTKIAIYDKNKKCIGTVGVSRDLTELKIVEDALLESQTMFKALFDNAPLAIFRIDNKQHIVEYNYRFRNMFGYGKSDDLSSLTTSDLLVDPELGNLIFDTVIETKEVSAEINLKRKNGDTFIANLTLALLEEGFKEITVEGIIEDITQMAVARDEIIKAKDKAVEADRLKSLFLANMSHEIRTPMNAIIGFSNMLREDTLTVEDRNYFIDVIQSNGNNLVSLIDSIVDFSKLEAEQMSVSMSEFNINPLVESIIDHTEKSLTSEGKSNIKVVKGAMSESQVRILSDRHRLNQVFHHLISNAIKFTDEGEIEIGYTIDESHLNFYVKDTGIGIDKGKHDYIFQRFTKIEDKNRLYGGTGLGLTISKGLVELMGGKVSIDSELGKGTKFTVSLPLQERNNNL